MSHHGLPCWYELTSNDPTAAQKFYATVVGWTWVDSGVEGMTYLLAKVGDAIVAGLAPLADPDQPVGWTFYVAVDDCDATVKQAQGLGATVIMPPMDIPGTGRFAILADPQGASFGLLQPLPPGAGGAFDQSIIGHGNWHDLGCPDPAAAAAFYGALFGWTITRSMPMGPDMVYHTFNHSGQDIGGFFEQTNPKQGSGWMVYFGAASTQVVTSLVPKAGGRVLQPPAEVPGGAFIVHCADGQGACFAMVGPA